jgi:hypothetical protein
MNDQKQKVGSVLTHRENDGAIKQSVQATPGPWIQESTSISAVLNDYSRVMLETGFCIARVYPRPTVEESNANARLIAAAPELLAFVERFARWASKATINASICGGELLPQAQSIIAKIKE